MRTHMHHSPLTTYLVTDQVLGWQEAPQRRVGDAVRFRFHLDGLVQLPLVGVRHVELDEAGEITKVCGDGTFDIRYDDGDSEQGVAADQREAHTPSLTWLGGAQRDTTDAPLDAPPTALRGKPSQNRRGLDCTHTTAS